MEVALTTFLDKELQSFTDQMAKNLEQGIQDD